MTAALSQNEPDLLNAPHRYGFLDAAPDAAFDRIAEIAAIFFRVPRAIVSLVCNDHIWFASPHGIETGKVERARWLCALAILSAVIYQRDALIWRALGVSEQQLVRKIANENKEQPGGTLESWAHLHEPDGKTRRAKLKSRWSPSCARSACASVANGASPTPPAIIHASVGGSTIVNGRPSGPRQSTV